MLVFIWCNSDQIWTTTIVCVFLQTSSISIIGTRRWHRDTSSNLQSKHVFQGRQLVCNTPSNLLLSKFLQKGKGGGLQEVGSWTRGCGYIVANHAYVTTSLAIEVTAKGGIHLSCVYIKFVLLAFIPKRDFSWIFFPQRKSLSGSGTRLCKGICEVGFDRLHVV